MANYKLSKLAKGDLIRIHEYSTRNFRESRAEKYFLAFFDRFEEIADRPFGYLRENQKTNADTRS